MKTVDIPPSAVMIGYYVAMFRMSDSKTVMARIDGVQDKRIIYTVLSGSDKGKKYSALHGPQFVHIFETPEECTEYFKLSD
jgi:hypothetical protein